MGPGALGAALAGTRRSAIRATCLDPRSKRTGPTIARPGLLSPYSAGGAGSSRSASPVPQSAHSRLAIDAASSLWVYRRSGKIGEILSASKREPDQPWPPVAVCEIIEMVRSRTLESGFEVGVYNRRGVTVRMPRDGGEQERSLAARYRRDAEALRFDWPRTAACLDRIAATYEYDATREDRSAEQRDWL